MGEMKEDQGFKGWAIGFATAALVASRPEPVSVSAHPGYDRLSRVRAWFANWLLARYMAKRCAKRKTKLVIRKSDGVYFAASSPQNLGYAMRGLFAKDERSTYFFARVRVWRGLLVISRKVFWRPNGAREFTLDNSALRDDLAATGFWLAPWPEATECMKIGND